VTSVVSTLEYSRSHSSRIATRSRWFTKSLVTARLPGLRRNPATIFAWKKLLLKPERQNAALLNNHRFQHQFTFIMQHQCGKPFSRPRVYPRKEP